MLLLAVLISIAAADSCPSFYWVKGGETCAGVCNDGVCGSSDSECQSTIAVGPCEGSATSASEYLEGVVLGTAAIKDDDTAYLPIAGLNDTTKISVSEKYEGWHSKDDGVDYAFSNTGVKVGSAASGGGVGVSSYLAKKDISTNVNSIYIGSGADDKIDDICISKITNGECGANRTFATGEYKFNIYGWTEGSSFSLDSDVKYFGARVRMKAVGANVTSVAVNGKTVAANGAADVKTVKLTFANNEGILIKFPTDFNYGQYSGRNVTMLGTQTTKIKVHTLDETEQTFLIDYLFDATNLKAAGKVFMYDPKVTTGDAAKLTTSAATGFVSWTVPTVLLFLAAAVMMY